jgi:hypothetical protein
VSRRRSIRILGTRRSLAPSLSVKGPNVLRRIVPIAYLLIGVLVAQQHNYLTNLNTFSRLLSAVLAIGLWPLVLIGVNLTIK